MFILLSFLIAIILPGAKKELPNDLKEKLVLAQLPIIEVSTGFAITQFKTNTPSAISIGESNLYPSIYLDGTAWIFGILGFSANYTRGVVIARGINSNPNYTNSVIMGPEFFNYMLKLRYMFSYLSWSSYLALRLGIYTHKFQLEIPSAYLHKTESSGWNLGLEYKMSLGAKSSFVIYTDFITLDSYLDNSIIMSTQNGMGYKIGAQFSFTLVESSRNRTLITIGYQFTTHIADLKSDSFDSRQALGVEYFEETFDNIYLSFSTWF